MMQKERIQLRINGETCEFWVEPNTLLINLLRNEMALTGTKYGCGTGQCGGCTVLVNGEPILSCLTLALAVDGAEIQTIEGVAEPDGTLDPIQEAFLDTAAIQCGYCTPGMILMAKDLLNKNTLMHVKSTWFEYIFHIVSYSLIPVIKSLFYLFQIQNKFSIRQN